jgi:hypothetical protein
MCLIRHRSGLLRQLPQLKQLVGHYLAIGLAANLSELSLGLMGLRGLPSDLGLMHLFPALGADG